MSPAQQREKVYRDALMDVWMVNYRRSASDRAREAMDAADAIPDAPVSDSCPCGDTGRPGHPEGNCGQRKTVPSRAELIELMRGSFNANRRGTVGECMARVLDALVKAGAVR